MFKIDLIVWKFVVILSIYLINNLFKIDLIVWKSLPIDIFTITHKSLK